jgi:hypothetical protein
MGVKMGRTMERSIFDNNGNIVKPTCFSREEIELGRRVKHPNIYATSIDKSIERAFTSEELSLYFLNVDKAMDRAIPVKRKGEGYIAIYPEGGIK